MFSPSDGTADPCIAVPVIAKGVQQQGGVILQNCAARGVELSAGRISSLVAELGTIQTSTVVMAGGAWASSFLNQQGLRFPQAAVRSSILAMAAGADLPDAVHTKDFSLTKRTDGQYSHVRIMGRIY